MANNWQKVKEELTCAICQDLLTDPKILPCLHSFCTDCLKQWFGRLANLDPSKRQLECPVCRAKVLLSSLRAVEELPSHFSAVRLVEIIRLQEQAESKKVTPICQNCDDEEKAVSSCRECAIFLCEFCEKSHKKTKATKEHKICSLKEMSKSSSEVPSILPEMIEMCPAHPNKPLELYCKCQEVLICQDCIIKKHKDHNYDVISDVVESEKNILREALPGIQQLVDEVESAVDGVKVRRKDVQSRRETNLKKLDDAFHAFRATIDRRHQQLRGKIEEDSKQKDKGLQIQEDELCFLLSQLRSCFSFIEDKVEHGVNQDLLSMKRSMLKRRDKLTEIKNKTRLRPVVQYPLPIRLKGMDEAVEFVSQYIG